MVDETVSVRRAGTPNFVSVDRASQPNEPGMGTRVSGEQFYNPPAPAQTSQVAPTTQEPNLSTPYGPAYASGGNIYLTSQAGYDKYIAEQNKLASVTGTPLQGIIERHPELSGLEAINILKLTTRPDVSTIYGITHFPETTFRAVGGLATDVVQRASDFISGTPISRESQFQRQLGQIQTGKEEFVYQSIYGNRNEFVTGTAVKTGLDVGTFLIPSVLAGGAIGLASARGIPASKIATGLTVTSAAIGGLQTGIGIGEFKQGLTGDLEAQAKAASDIAFGGLFAYGAVSGFKALTYEPKVLLSISEPRINIREAERITGEAKTPFLGKTADYKYEFRGLAESKFVIRGLNEKQFSEGITVINAGARKTPNIFERTLARLQMKDINAINYKQMDVLPQYTIAKVISQKEKNFEIGIYGADISRQGLIPQQEFLGRYKGVVTEFSPEGKTLEFLFKGYRTNLLTGTETRFAFDVGPNAQIKSFSAGKGLVTYETIPKTDFGNLFPFTKATTFYDVARRPIAFISERPQGYVPEIPAVYKRPSSPLYTETFKPDQTLANINVREFLGFKTKTESTTFGVQQDIAVKNSLRNMQKQFTDFAKQQELQAYRPKVFGSLTKEKSIISERQQFKQYTDTFTIPKQSPFEIYFPATANAQAQSQFTTTIPRQTTGQIPRQAFSPPPSTGQIPRQAFPPIYFPFLFPPIGGGISGYEKRYSFKIPKSFLPRGYKPSLGALLFGIRGRVSKKALRGETLFTGVELRPIPIQTRRKRKGNKMAKKRAKRRK